MIYLKNDNLVFRFPDVHKDAGVEVNFQRTLRLPDDGTEHALPPGLGKFPLRHLEDYDLGSNNHLKSRGGLLMPMFQADALWLNFYSIPFDYPVALKIATGKICAVSGEEWVDRLNRDPQDYVVVPNQPWLDGYNVSKGVIRQFVAAPLGEGVTVEEQSAGRSDIGGIQIEAFPMKRQYYVRSVSARRRFEPRMNMNLQASSIMGLSAGGKMKQKIYEDPHKFEAWDLRRSERCFITIANAAQWMSITGEEPPLSPVSVEQYNIAGLPWFSYFDDDKKAIEGAKAIGKLESFHSKYKKKGDSTWADEKMKSKPTVVQANRKVVHSGTW